LQLDGLPSLVLRVKECAAVSSAGFLEVAFDEQRIDAIFAELSQYHLPGAAVGIAIDGRPVYRKGFGLASMELPITLSPTIRMRIASVSKHFTCLAYLLLCEKGRAELDDPIGKYLPEVHPVARGVTMRQLMGHIGGLRDAHDITYHSSGIGQPISAAQFLALYRDIDSVNFSSGTGWSYNNGGYLLVSAAIERIAAQPLEDVLRKHIFEPIGMYDTMLRRWDTEFVANSATLHMGSPAGRFVKSYVGKEHLGEGGIVSTVDDMLRWLAHMDAPVIGDAGTWHAMKTPQRLANGTSTGYGLGLMTGRYRGADILFHGGTLLGCSSWMLKVPAAALDVAIMTNRHDAVSGPLALEVLNASLVNLDPIPSLLSGPFAEGVFRSTSTDRLIQLFAKDGVQFASLDGWDLPMMPDDDGVLHPFPANSFYRYAITRIGDPARPHGVRLSDFGNVDELIVVASLQSADVGAIEGRYRSEISAIEATIVRAEPHARLIAKGQFGSIQYALTPLANDVWRADAVNGEPLGGMLVFVSRSEGFCFSTGRTRQLAFRRCHS
jgi:CubicO group peptidase (beta-lactamase class C family)